MTQTEKYISLCIYPNMGDIMEKELSDNDIIDLISKRFKERNQKISELEFMFQKMEEMNEKLIKSEQNKSRFLAIIRNEFNNPLFGMLTIIKDKVLKYEDDEIDVVYHDMLKLNFQLNNIMAAAEIENDVLEKNISEFELKPLFNDIIETFSNLYKDKNHKISLNIDSDLQTIFHDREKLFFVLNNVLDNAYKFSPESSNIDLIVTRDEKKIIFTCENPGNEINERNVLESFHDNDENFVAEKRGLGLGFNILKAYVDFLNGDFQLFSGKWGK